MCAYKRKTWLEKLNIDRKPVIEKADKDFAGIKAGQMMLIPTPKLVDAYIRQIPKGRQVDTETIRKDLAAEYHAEAAYEEYEKGTSLNKITPFWRVINEESPAAKKLTFGTKFLKEQRKKEGII